MATLSDDDEGKFLVDAEGEQLGIVTGVRDGVAYVDPDPGIAESWMDALGWSDADADDYAVPGDAVETVTDDELRLRGDV